MRASYDVNLNRSKPSRQSIVPPLAGVAGERKVAHNGKLTQVGGALSDWSIPLCDDDAPVALVWVGQENRRPTAEFLHSFYVLTAWLMSPSAGDLCLFLPVRISDLFAE